MKKFASVTLLACALSTALAVQADDKIIASVNGTNFTEADFQSYAKSRIGVAPGPNLPMDKRNELMEELVNRELIYQNSLEEGFDQTDEIQSLIYEQIRNIIAGQRIKKLLAETPVSDEELQKVYEQQIAETANREYRARHILVKDEDTAIKVIDKLNKGADFIKTAKEESTGPSAAEGGDLGWFAPNQMVKPFSNAVAKLKPGEYTKRAVKTRFGWHIIKLEEKRKVNPPSFHSMQEQLLNVVQNQIIADYIDSLRDKASVDIK